MFLRYKLYNQRFNIFIAAGDLLFQQVLEIILDALISATGANPAGGQVRLRRHELQLNVIAMHIRVHKFFNEIGANDVL